MLKKIIKWLNKKTLPKIIHIVIDKELTERSGPYTDTRGCPIYLFLSETFSTDDVKVGIVQFSLKGVTYHMDSPFNHIKYQMIRENDIPFKTYAEKIS